MIGTGRRFLRFNLVGGAGMALQLGTLALLAGPLGVGYLAATAAAVEAAVLHNFWWHERYTWRERTTRRKGGAWARLLRFHVSNGLVSLAGNLLLMRLLAGSVGMSPLPANVLAIAVCALVNFALCDRLVFAPG